MIKVVCDVKFRMGQLVCLIVVDILVWCFGGNDENDVCDMGVFIEGCDVIKCEIGVMLLVVYYLGKDDIKGVCGFSVFRVVFDVEFNVWCEGDGGVIILICIKMKDVEELKQVVFDLCMVELFIDCDGELILLLVVQDLL